MQDDNVLEICLTTLNILNSAELHFKMVKKVHFVLCIFTTIKKKNEECKLSAEFSHKEVVSDLSKNIDFF